MTFTAKSVGGLIPGFMALSLVGHSAGTIPKYWGPGMKRKSVGDVVGDFVPVMVGVPMLGQVSTQIAALP